MAVESAATEAGKWVLSRHGPWALFTCVLTVAFYFLQLAPSAEREELYSTTIVDNAKRAILAVEQMVVETGKMRQGETSIAESMNGIEKSVLRQEAMQGRIDKTLEARLELDRKAQESMTAFCKQVRTDHPQQDQKLDAILKEVKKP